MDCFDKKTRSRVMQSVSSKNTTPEMLVRSFLHKNGFRFRLHSKKLPGHPDIVLPKYKTVIEVRGCFWHRHENCPDTTMPTSHTEFWEKKFERNVERDKANEVLISKMGWKCIVIWTCQLCNPNTLGRLLQKISSNEIPKKSARSSHKPRLERKCSKQ